MLTLFEDEKFRRKVAVQPNTILTQACGTLVPEWLHENAFCSFLMFAVKKDALLEQFRLDTGHDWRPPKNFMEKMVDDACGKTEDDILLFIEWAAKSQWGWDETPDVFKEKIRERGERLALNVAKDVVALATPPQKNSLTFDIAKRR